MVWELSLNKTFFKKSPTLLGEKKKGKGKNLSLLHSTASALAYLDNLWFLEELAVL